MSLNRMLEQTDLETVYNHYVNAYLSHYHTTKHWSEFNDFRILRSLDGLSAVYFSPETVLFGTEEQRIAEAAVAKSIAARLIECMAYFLAQNISVNDIPNTLKISLAICHSQTHWTGIEINVSSFKDAYMDILNFCKDYLIEFDPADEATILHNRAKNAIYNKLGILLEKVIESDVIPDEAQKALSVVNYFSSHSRLTVKHFDSLNSNAYFERVTRSLQLISNLIHLEKAPCSQQIGNTCGDHDVYNLFISGIMGITPIVNGIGAVNSNELRKLADCKDNRKASEFATTIIENVKQLDKNTPDELAQIRKANDAIAEIGHYVCNLIHQLERIDISKVTAIVHSAASVQAHKNKYLSVEMNQSQRELFQELTTLFQGGHHIFAKCDLPQELHIPYGLYAENFALETCVGIEQQIILNALESKKESDAEGKLKVALEEKQRQDEEAARIKAAEEEAKRQADAEAKHKAAMEEKQRQDEEAARIKAAEEAKRQADAEAAEAQKKQNELDNKLTQLISSVAISDVDQAVIAANIKKIMADYNVELNTKADEIKIRRLVLLEKFKHHKSSQISRLNFVNDYALRLKDFMHHSVQFIMQDRPIQDMQKLVESRFNHCHKMKRFFADVALVISFIIGVGIVIGCKRLKNGQTFFKSSNTTLKEFENIVVNRF